MIEVKSRSAEAWGPLAELSDQEFFKLVNGNNNGKTKESLKKCLAQKKKLKKYKVQFIQQLMSDPFVIEAENEYDVRSAARDFFKKNADQITFKTKPVGKWAGDYSGYDQISYVKVTK